MNYTDTLKSVELVLATGEVPLIVGESGIGKTALARDIAGRNGWSLIIIDGNLLKEGEIGGLPAIETYTTVDESGIRSKRKTTVYAVHHKLREIDEELSKGHTVLLFIDEINRCEHAVQQELMNLILNREINGYQLFEGVRVIAAMNPSGKYGSNYDYQVVDMDAAQENRFVWLTMEPDHLQWLDWAMEAGIDPGVMEFISTFPEYLNKSDSDSIKATPRSYERISKAYQVYKERGDIPRAVFLNVLRGNVGRLIAEELINFLEASHTPLLSYTDVFTEEAFTGPFHASLKERVEKESHTRLYLSAKNILKALEVKLAESTLPPDDMNLRLIQRLIELLQIYPADLRIGIMKEIKRSYPAVYRQAIEQEAFVELYFEAYSFRSPVHS